MLKNKMTNYSPMQKAKTGMYRAGLSSLAMLMGACTVTQQSQRPLALGSSVVASVDDYVPPSNLRHDQLPNPKSFDLTPCTEAASKYSPVTLEECLDDGTVQSWLDKLQFGASLYSSNPDIPGINQTRLFFPEPSYVLVQANRNESHTFKGLRDVNTNATLLRYIIVSENDMTPPVRQIIENTPEFIHELAKSKRTPADIEGGSLIAAAYILGTSHIGAITDGVLIGAAYVGGKQLNDYKNHGVSISQLKPAFPILDGRLANTYSFLVIGSDENGSKDKPYLVQSRATPQTQQDAKEKMAWGYYEVDLALGGNKPVKVHVLQQLYVDNEKSWATMWAVLEAAALGKINCHHYHHHGHPSNQINGGNGNGGPVINPPVNPPTPPTGGEYLGGNEIWIAPGG